MSSTPVQPPLILNEHQEKHKIEEVEDDEDEEELEIHQVVDVCRFRCFSLLLQKRDFISKGEKLYGQWKQEQKLRASRMEFHLSEDWALDKLIEEQLSRFDAHYSRTTVDNCTAKDVTQYLIPKCRLPLEMATLAWLGNWRPSAILNLLHSLSRANLGLLKLDQRGNRILLQLIRETRVEEAVLDEEMAEVQATCVLHLPFSPSCSSSNSRLGCIHSEFKKINRVVTQAQKLRYRTLQFVVKKLLSRTQAAEFLVAFAGIQDMVHEYAVTQKQQKGPVSVTIKPF
ncbi:hypothetical protein ACHQM5_030178 [Ranunculus cassubicifolius]